MREASRGEGFAAEPLHEALVVREPAAEDLHGDRPLEHAVGAQVDLGHPTAAEEPPHLVAACEDLPFGRHRPFRLRERSMRPAQAAPTGLVHSHSIVPGGFDVTS